MKKIVIKSKLRFVTFLLVMLTLLSILFVSLLELGTVYSKSDIDYVTYIVDSGETLWDIAKNNNYKNKDIRKVIYEIQEYNHIDCNISVGQEIKIPLS